MKIQIFFFFFSLAITSHCLFAKSDSIGIEKQGEKYFLLYRVEKGDDVYAIAKKYNITAKDILANNPNADNIKDGQILRITYKKNVPQMKAYKVKSGESLLGISKRLAVPLEQIHKLNGFYHSKIKAGQQLLVGFDIKAEGVFTVPYNAAAQLVLNYHTVQKGDNLFRIAKDFNTKSDSIILWNGLENANIQLGQLLLVGRTPANKVENKFAQNQAQEVINNAPISEKGTGQAMYIGSSQLYALHKNAPIGTFLTVHNESLARSVRVKVIGHIPANEVNTKFLVKLSEAACEELGFINKEFPVLVVYRVTVNE